MTVRLVSCARWRGVVPVRRFGGQRSHRRGVGGTVTLRGSLRRDVAAHIHGEPDDPEVIYAVTRSGFSPSRAGRILDQRQRARHSLMFQAILEERLANLNSASSDQSTEVQLSEMVIHQQDIRGAISCARSIPCDAVVEVLGFSTSRAGFLSVNRARWRFCGPRLVTIDGPWSQGNGEEVMRTEEALIMTVNGRPEAVSDLSGPGASILAGRTVKWANKFMSDPVAGPRRHRGRRAIRRAPWATAQDSVLCRGESQSQSLGPPKQASRSASSQRLNNSGESPGSHGIGPSLVRSCELKRNGATRRVGSTCAGALEDQLNPTG